MKEKLVECREETPKTAAQYLAQPSYIELRVLKALADGPNALLPEGSCWHVSNQPNLAIAKETLSKLSLRCWIDECGEGHWRISDKGRCAMAELEDKLAEFRTQHEEWEQKQKEQERGKQERERKQREAPHSRIVTEIVLPNGGGVWLKRASLF